MNILGFSTILMLLLPSSASACRDAYRTHEARMEVARTAGIARVAGVLIPALEKEGYVDIQNFPDAVYGDRTIRLTFIETLKGNPPKRIELTLMHCEGSLSAKVGELVAVYRIHGKWRLDHWPAKPPIRHVPRN